MAYKRYGFALGYQYTPLCVCLDLSWPTWIFDSACDSSYLLWGWVLPAWLQLLLSLEQL